VFFETLPTNPDRLKPGMQAWGPPFSS